MEFFRGDEIDKINQLSLITNIWKKARETYPGWIILPADKRRSLWIYTSGWVNYVSVKDEFPAPMDIDFTYELVWRFDKSLMPFTDILALLIERILNKYWPFPNQKFPVETQIRMDQNDQYNWDEIRHKWTELSLSIFRFYRQEGLHEQWIAMDNKFSSITQYLTLEQRARWFYERALDALFSLNVAEVKKQLSLWPQNDSLPFWEVKRAGIMAEVGNGTDAEKIIEHSLGEIRSKMNLQPVTNDYSAVSKEAYTLMLLRYLKDSNFYRRGKLEQEDENQQRNFTERWNYLKRYRCDPWSELDLFETDLKRPPIIQQEFSENETFDIGRKTQTHHMNTTDAEAIIAYNFLHFCEELAIPFRIPGTSLGKKSAEGTLSRISKYSPRLAVATMVRIGDVKDIDEIFNRESLQTKSIAQVDALIEEYMMALKNSRDDINAGDGFFTDNFGIVLAHMVPEILSRLCCKCSHSMRLNLLDFLLSIYKSDNRTKYRGISKLLERLLESLSDKQHISLIPKLLEFPILGDLPLPYLMEFPNPFKFFRETIGFELKEEKPIINIEKVNELLSLVFSQTGETKKRAVLNLFILYNYGLLNKEQAISFGEALWSKVDKHGLPLDTGLFIFAFLGLPVPKGIEPISLIRGHLMANSVTNWHNIIGATMYVDWTEEDVSKVVFYIKSKWDKDKNKLLREKKLPAQLKNIKRGFENKDNYIVDALVKVIAPNINDETSEKIKREIYGIILDLKEHGVPTLRVEAAFSHVFRKDELSLIRRIIEGLLANSNEIVSDALESITQIKSHLEKSKFSLLLCSLGQMIQWRLKESLPNALNTAGRIISKGDWEDNEFEVMILRGLKSISKNTELSAKVKGATVFEKLLIRRFAAHLAYVLYEYYRAAKKEIPAEIRIWEGICQSENEFAEIRIEWERIIN